MNKKRILIFCLISSILTGPSACFSFFTGTFFTSKKNTPIAPLSTPIPESIHALIAKLDLSQKVEPKEQYPKHKTTVLYGLAAAITAAVHVAALDTHMSLITTTPVDYIPVSGSTLLLTADIAALSTRLFYHHKDALQKKLGKKKAITLGAVGITALTLTPVLLSESSARQALIATGKYFGEKIISGTSYFLDCVLQGLCHS